MKSKTSISIGLMLLVLAGLFTWINLQEEKPKPKTLTVNQVSEPLTKKFQQKVRENEPIVGEGHAIKTRVEMFESK